MFKDDSVLQLLAAVGTESNFIEEKKIVVVHTIELRPCFKVRMLLLINFED